jgi:thiol-disulfide isomerase/thioredoxin
MRNSRAVLFWTTFLIAFGIPGAGWLGIAPGTAGAFTGMKAPAIASPDWINSGPLPPEALRGKVVLVEFWTFGCFNCRNVEPRIKDWHQRYSDRGLVVIGIHSPEFSYEKNVDRVRQYVRDHRIPYAVAIDNDYENWNRFGNHYWPALYLIGKNGIVRYRKVGEGDYARTEKMIERLLDESF